MATSFEDFVNRQHRAANETERSIDWARELEEWRDHLKQFNAKVLEFLKAYVDQDKVRVEHVTKRIHEQQIGRYEVKAIEVVIGNTKVKFEPIGTNLFGAKGRIDMKGPSGTVRFVLVPENSSAPNIRIRIQNGAADPEHDDPAYSTSKWAWKISTPPPNIKYVEISRRHIPDGDHGSSQWLARQECTPVDRVDICASAFPGNSSHSSISTDIIVTSKCR